jgi:hypothetical protein
MLPLAPNWVMEENKINFTIWRHRPIQCPKLMNPEASMTGDCSKYICNGNGRNRVDRQQVSAAKYTVLPPFILTVKLLPDL